MIQTKRLPKVSYFGKYKNLAFICMRIAVCNLFLSLSLPFALCPLLSASIYDDEVKISGQLQEHLQNELERVYGKDKMSVLVRVELMLEPGIRNAISKSFARSAGYDISGGKSRVKFLWLEQKSGPDKYILPGFPAKKELAVPPPQEKIDPSLVIEAGTRIRKIAVRLSVDKREPEEKVKSAASIVRTYLNMNSERGDVLSVERFSMPSVWQKMTRDPGVFSGFLKMLMFILLAIAGLYVFINAVRAVSGMFRSSSAQIAGAIAENARHSAATRAVPELGRGGKEALAGKEASPLRLEDKSAASEKIIDIPTEKVGRLYYLIHKEAAENIAMVLPYLREEVRSAFLKLLPREKSMEVMASLMQVRFIEPEVFFRLKSEIETRVQNTVGGIEQVIGLIQDADYTSSKELLELMKERKPELYMQIRPQILLLEDLKLLEDSEWQMALPARRMHDLAAALCGRDGTQDELTQELLTRVRKNFPGSTRQVFEETISSQSRVTKEQVFDSRDMVMKVFKNMIKDRRIHDPLADLRAGSQQLGMNS